MQSVIVNSAYVRTVLPETWHIEIYIRPKIKKKYTEENLNIILQSLAHFCSYSRCISISFSLGVRKIAIRNNWNRKIIIQSGKGKQNETNGKKIVIFFLNRICDTKNLVRKLSGKQYTISLKIEKHLLPRENRNIAIFPYT